MVIKGRCVTKNMNKFLSEIEIHASNSFGEKNCRQFVDETRPIVIGVYNRLKRNIRSNYGKVVVVLFPQSVLDEYSLPPCEFDDMSGVCVINYSYDLNRYLNEKTQSGKNEIVYKILKDAFSSSPKEVGLDSNSVIEILTNVYKEIIG